MEERLEILDSIERGDISVEEGLRRLQGGGEEEGPQGAATAPEPAPMRPVIVRVIWRAVFWAGVAVLAGGGVLVSAVYTWSLRPVWQIVGAVLFAFGLAVMLTGWWMRTARWLSIRIREEGGTRITLAFPVPLGLVYWAVRVARPFVPQLHNAPVDELVLALRDTLDEGEPFVVDIHDEEDGDYVQVYLS
jgi:hypothetical protein